MSSSTISNGAGNSSILPHREELFLAAKRHLSRQHTTLWGRSFNVYDEPDVAAEWLADQVMAVYREAIWPAR